MFSGMYLLIAAACLADRPELAPIELPEFTRLADDCVKYRREHFGRMKVRFVVRHGERADTDPPRPLSEYAFLIYDDDSSLRVEKSNRIFDSDKKAWTDWNRPERFIIRDDMAIKDYRDDLVMTISRVDGVDRTRDAMRLPRPRDLGMTHDDIYEASTLGLNAILGRADLTPRLDESGTDPATGLVWLTFADQNDAQLRYEVQIDPRRGPSIVRARQFRVIDGTTVSEGVNDIELAKVVNSDLWFVGAIKRTIRHDNVIVYEDLVTVTDAEVPGTFTPEIFELASLPVSVGRTLYDSTKPNGQNDNRWNGIRFEPYVPEPPKRARDVKVNQQQPSSPIRTILLVVNGIALLVLGTWFGWKAFRGPQGNQGATPK